MALARPTFPVKTRIQDSKEYSYKSFPIYENAEYFSKNAYYYKKHPEELPDQRIRKCVNSFLSNLREPVIRLPHDEEMKVAKYVFEKQLEKVSKDVTHLVLSVGYEGRLKGVNIVSWRKDSENKIASLLHRVSRSFRTFWEHATCGVMVKIKKSFFEEYLKAYEKIANQHHCACLYIIPYRVHIITSGKIKVLVCNFDTESG